MRLRLLALLGTMLVLAAVVARTTGSAPPSPTVIDGDTLEVDGALVQLYGIDAPELGQLCDSDGYRWPCGVEAALALRKLVTFGGHHLDCAPWGNRASEQAAGGDGPMLCKIGHEDVALVMLHNGNAVAVPGSFPDYVDGEQQARRARLGIWHSRFTLPWRWREQASGADRDCNVKGVVGADGERGYVVPSDPGYRAVTLAADRGERLFCSDEEARAAGWSHAAATDGTP
jgi:endonuclease YncB( thermonuclease family)